MKPEKQARRDLNIALAVYWIGLLALAAYGLSQCNDVIDGEPIYDSPVRDSDCSGVAFGLEPRSLVIKPATPRHGALWSFWDASSGA